MENKTLKSRALNNLSGNWGLSIGVALLAAMLGGLSISTSFNLNIDEEILQKFPRTAIAVLTAVGSFAGTVNLLHFILGGTINLGYTRFLLDQHDGKELSCKILFSQFDRFGQGFLQKFLRGLYIALWSLLFIIPGIVKSYSYAMTPYIMTEHPEMTANEAITASRQLMDGHKMELFLLQLSFIGWMILNIFTLGIGSLWLNPYMQATEAAFYRYLTGTYRPTDTYVEYE